MSLAQNSLYFTFPDLPEVAQRLRNVFVTVAVTESKLFDNSPGSRSLCKYVHGYLNTYYTLIECERPIKGQLVQIMINDISALHVYEIEVHGL